MSIHAVILANQGTRTLERTIHAMLAQTTPPEQITVLANIPPRQNLIHRICADMGVGLHTTYDPEMVIRQTAHAYHLLPATLEQIRQDRVMILRDTDIPSLRLFQSLEGVFLEDEHERKRQRRTTIVCCRWFKRSEGEYMPIRKGDPLNMENTRFCNTMMSAVAVRQALPLWEPLGINAGNDYDLIKQAQRYGQLVMIPEVLIESDPIYFASIYSSKEKKEPV